MPRRLHFNNKSSCTRLGKEPRPHPHYRRQKKAIPSCVGEKTTITIDAHTPVPVAGGLYSTNTGDDKDMLIHSVETLMVSCGDVRAASTWRMDSLGYLPLPIFNSPSVPCDINDALHSDAIMRGAVFIPQVLGQIPSPDHYGRVPCAKWPKMPRR